MSNSTTIERAALQGLRSRTRGDKVIWTAVFLLAIVSLLVVFRPHTRVHPGHGRVTTLGDERATNPFLRELAHHQ